MEIILYNLEDEELQKIDELENEHPEIVVKTVLDGFDSGVYTQLIVDLLPSLIEAAGAIIAAIIVARATNDSKKPKEKNKKTDNSDGKPKTIIIKDDDGKEHKILTVEDLYKVLNNVYGK